VKRTDGKPKNEKAIARHQNKQKEKHLIPPKNFLLSSEDSPMNLGYPQTHFIRAGDKLSVTFGRNKSSNPRWGCERWKIF
jgi:hypothetical protein